MKIGLTYVKGAVPGFENFGHLPTDLVKPNGLVDGVKANKELDALIIPGGTILESNSITSELATEIKFMAKDGKPIIGICAGYQVLGTKTDIGRKSPCPIIKEGLGLLDAEFSPLISSDRVEAILATESFLTKNIKETITGFHCHTYGYVKGDSTPILYSPIKRMNYGDNNDKLLSGSMNDDGNVIGTMIHNFLDENPEVIANFFKFICADETEIDSIYSRNTSLIKEINKEIGVDSGIKIDQINPGDDCFFSRFKKKAGEMPKALMIGSTGSDSGKTFLTTGIAGVLRKKGLNVAILKVGPDTRDTVPGLYLTNGIMEDFTSIKIGHLGWMEIPEVLANLKESNYDIVLIEGVMSVFTGILNEKVPYSGAEIAASSNIPMLLVSGVNKGGIESAAIDLANHAEILKKMGIDIKGILLNKVYDMSIFDRVTSYISSKTGVEDVIAMPKIKLEARGATPEVEIHYDEFSVAALKAIDKNLDIVKIANMAECPEFNRYLSLNEIQNYFR